MEFNWTETEKEVYREKAESLIKTSGLEGKIFIDRTQFRINTRDNTVKVEIQKVSSKTRQNMELWKIVKKIQGFEADKPTFKSEFGRLEKRRFYSGRIVFNLN